MRSDPSQKERVRYEIEQEESQDAVSSPNPGGSEKRKKKKKKQPRLGDAAEAVDGGTPAKRKKKPKKKSAAAEPEPVKSEPNDNPLSLNDLAALRGGVVAEPTDPGVGEEHDTGNQNQQHADDNDEAANRELANAAVNFLEQANHVDQEDAREEHPQKENAQEETAQEENLHDEDMHEENSHEENGQKENYYEEHAQESAQEANVHEENVQESAPEDPQANGQTDNQMDDQMDDQQVAAPAKKRRKGKKAHKVAKSRSSNNDEPTPGQLPTPPSDDEQENRERQRVASPVPIEGQDNRENEPAASPIPVEDEPHQASARESRVPSKKPRKSKKASRRAEPAVTSERIPDEPSPEINGVVEEISHSQHNGNDDELLAEGMAEANESPVVDNEPENVEQETEYDFPSAQKPQLPEELAETPAKPKKKKAKRRLPVSDDEAEQAVASSQKKTRKPKTPLNARTLALVSEGDAGPPSSTASTTSARVRKRKAPAISGPFSMEELRTLDLAVKECRDRLEITQQEINERIQTTTGNPEDRQAMWNMICEKFPDRDRQAVLKCTRRKYHNFGIRGVWSEEDTQQLAELYEVHGKAWKKIGEIMSRHPEDVRDKVRNYLVCGDKQVVNQTWSEDEEKALREAIHNYLESVRQMQEERAAKGFEDELPENNEELLDWGRISEKLGHKRSRLQCLQKWRLLQKRDNDETRSVASSSSLSSNRTNWRARAAMSQYKKMLIGDKYDLLTGIRESQAATAEKIPWNRIGGKKFQGRWSVRAMKIAWQNLCLEIPEDPEVELQEKLSTLSTKLETEHPDELEDYYDFAQDKKAKEDLKRKRAGSSARNSKKHKASEKFIESEEDEEDTIMREGDESPAEASNEQNGEAEEEAEETPEETPAPKPKKRRSLKPKKLLSMRKDKGKQKALDFGSGSAAEDEPNTSSFVAREDEEDEYVIQETPPPEDQVMEDHGSPELGGRPEYHVVENGGSPELGGPPRKKRRNLNFGRKRRQTSALLGEDGDDEEDMAY